MTTISIIFILLAVLCLTIVCQRSRQWNRFKKSIHGDIASVPMYCEDNNVCWVDGMITHKSDQEITVVIDKNTLKTDRLCDRSCCSQLQAVRCNWKDADLNHTKV